MHDITLSSQRRPYHNPLILLSLSDLGATILARRNGGLVMSNAQLSSG